MRVYLDPPESLRRRWKVARDCSRRGYTTSEVLEELDRREPDAVAYIRPQRHDADVVVRFGAPPGEDESDAVHLDSRTCCCARSCPTPTSPTWSASPTSG